jgi:hypothetical protein
MDAYVQLVLPQTGFEALGEDGPQLRERFDGFDYGYRMRCDCGG